MRWFVKEMIGFKSLITFQKSETHHQHTNFNVLRVNVVPNAHAQYKGHSNMPGAFVMQKTVQ